MDQGLNPDSPNQRLKGMKDNTSWDIWKMCRLFSWASHKEVQETADKAGESMITLVKGTVKAIGKK